MNLSLFYHSLVSDWNHGNAHFLRGVVGELLARGHRVKVYEPADGWSRANLVHDEGPAAIDDFHRLYPEQENILYQRESLDLEKITAESDVIIVHEWNEPWLVNGLGNLHNERRMRAHNDKPTILLFHDTHHRAVSDSAWLQRFRLDHYDGILAFGRVLSDIYRRHGWSDAVWIWHEAADTRMFYPRHPDPHFPSGDLVWIGNWGDDERSTELDEFLFRPVQDLGLRCSIYGVRYPQKVLRMLRDKGIQYFGRLANFHVPQAFAHHAVTVHVPRRYYAGNLPGIPTIRPFEALACGIPLISAPWHDSECLFTPGRDYLVAQNGEQMRHHLRKILHDREFARQLSAHGLHTIKTRHTCAHRIDQLLQILHRLGMGGGEGIPAAASAVSAAITH